MSVELSILIVSDYEGHDGGSWRDVRQTLAALAAQPDYPSVECIVVESVAKRASLTEELPGCRVEWVDATSSYALKNAGARAAQGRHVAILDADCVPAEDWLATAFRCIHEQPTAAVTSGVTRYAGNGSVERCLGALSRSYVERGAAGVTRHISNNNAVYHREALLAYPLPEDATAFSSMLQSNAMRSAGEVLRFEPSLLVTHAFSGWGMERDIRKNLGYSTLHNRLQHPELPFAGLARLGVLAVPIFAGGRWAKSSLQCLSHGHRHGVTWKEQPLAVALAAVVTAFELPGMMAAVRGRDTGRTAYR